MTACATNQQFVGGRLSLPEKIAPEEGVMVMKLVGIQRLSVFNAKWKSIKLTNKKTDLVTEIFDTAPPFASYSLFMGTLPAGQYEITGLEALGPGPGTFGVIPALVIMAMTTDSQTLNARLGTFTVQPGKLANLGTVVSSFSEVKDEPMRVAVLNSDFGRKAALNDVDPEARTRVEKMPSTSWDKTAGGNENAALANIRKFATNVAALETTAEKQVLIGSALGMLHLRQPGGEWQHLATGALDTLTYVKPLESGRIFAANESGKYFVWLPERRDWFENKLAGSDYRIFGLEAIGAHGYAFLAGSTWMPTLSNPMKTKLLFKKNLLDNTPPVEVLEIEGFPALGRLPMFYDGTHLQVFFNHVGISRKVDRYRIDPASLEKKQDTLDFWANNFYRVADGTLVMDRMNGISHYNSFSSDQGKTWRHNEEGGPHSVRFIDSRHGYGLSTLSMGWSTVTGVLNKTDDGGKTWVQTGKPLELAGLAPVRVIDGVVYVHTGKELVSTVDEGATWKTEWPNAR